MNTLTTAEIKTLRLRSASIENARNFTASMQASERLDAYIDRLLAKGRDADQIIGIVHP